MPSTLHFSRSSSIDGPCAADTKYDGSLKVVVWNMRRASTASPAWDYFNELSPDLALLQEVSGVPARIATSYQCALRHPAGRSDKPQRFNTAILVRGTLLAELGLTSEWNWVNEELQRFSGNLVGRSLCVCGRELNVLSAYSPAWPVASERLTGVDSSTIKLIHNQDVWVTELLWAALRVQKTDGDRPWIVAGDLNSSETFDYMWRNGPRGNREFLDRMAALGFIECLRHANGALVPTFKTPRGQKVVHQLDHLFVSAALVEQLRTCTVGDRSRVFDNSLSDHLPIIAEFE